MITLIHGPAELLRTEALAEIRAGIAEDAELAELNMTRLDGRQVTMAELQNACDTMPFLAERRLVVVEALLGRLAGHARARSPVLPVAHGPGIAPEPWPARPGSASRAREPGQRLTTTTEPVSEPSLPPDPSASQVKALLTYLDRAPETVELVFLEDTPLTSGTIFQHLLKLRGTGRARIILCEKPKRNDLSMWIRKRARLRKVQLNAAAVADLAEFVGDDLRQLDQELIKLADYAGGGKEVTSVDVRRLVSASRAASVFDLVEALGTGNTATASRLMQHALDIDDEPPLRLLGMIGRQYRLLIQAKALQAEGVKPAEIAKALNVQDWTVSKLLTQAGRHSFVRLQTALERVLAADEAIKTGKAGDREAMDVLLAQLMEG